MTSSGMLRSVALVRTDVSEELSASFIRIRTGELGTTLAVTSNRSTLRRNTECWSRAVCCSHVLTFHSAGECFAAVANARAQLQSALNLTAS
jgi:hypothetical protein